MSFITLKEKIKTELQEISTIQQVADYPTQDFQGYPAACVRSDRQTAQYESTSENYEEYAFTVYLLQNLDGVWDVVKSREIIEELCDQVRDHFDSDEFLSGISMPSGRVLLGIRPTSSEIFEEENGKFVVAEISIICRVSKSI
jgi:hypothetical protein